VIYKIPNQRDPSTAIGQAAYTVNTGCTVVMTYRWTWDAKCYMIQLQISVDSIADLYAHTVMLGVNPFLSIYIYPVAARKLNKEDAMDRCKWRKMIKEAR